MKKIIYTLIAAFVACTAVAQTPSAYFMEGSTFRSQLNPAFAPLRGYVNIPVLGGVQVNVSGNLSVSDIFYPVNGSLVTLFDKNVSAAEALGNLRSKNMLGTDARINIVGFGAFRKDHKTFWSFDLNMRVEAEANMPYSLFDFLKNGRNEAVINDIKASTQAYLEAAFSYSFPLTDQIYLGARGKFLVGAGRARTSIDRLDIKLQENSWNIDADGSFEMSGLEMSSMQRPDGSEYYSFNDFDVSSYKGPAGYGFAVDLGVAGGVRLCSKGSQVVPMLDNLAIFIKAEDVKGHLLASTSEVIDGLEEHIVPVLKGTDVFHGGLTIGRRQVFHGADKGILASAIGQIVLDVVLVQQLTGSLRIAGSEGADQGQGLFGVGLFLLDVAFHLAAGRAAFGSRTRVRGGSGVAGASSQDGSNQGQRKGAGNKLFHCDNLLWGIDCVLRCAAVQARTTEIRC